MLLIIVLSSCASSRHEIYEPHTAVASWYGAEFHGRQTACGEIFDMYRATCAHKEFPFGSILRITNRANGKSADCKVNDRGPFVSGRDIDLSYAVAKEIGLVGAGMGTVRIEYVGRDLSYVRQVRYVASGGPFTIQLGSFRERDNAIRLKTGLDLKYGGVYIIEAFVESTNYFRVRVGRFQRREEAAEVAKVMAEEGYSPLVTRYDERA